MSLLEVSGLDAGYGNLQVLDDVDLEVDPGEFVTVVGPNGAGKSTALKTIVGFATHMGGTITFQGQEITGLPPEQIVRRGVSYVPQSGNIFPTMTVRENLEIGAYIRPDLPTDRLEAVHERFPILEERADQSAGTLSGGQRQMLAMGQALMIDPQLLVVDEPSAGLAPDLVDETFDRLAEINAAGTAVLMVEQNAKKALRQSDRGYVLAQGRNFRDGPGAELLEDEEVRRRFLGG